MLFERGLLPLFRIHRQCRVDEAVLINAEQYQAVEAVPLGQNLRHHRHRLLAALFLVGDDQHDSFAGPGQSGGAGIGEKGVRDRQFLSVAGQKNKRGNERRNDRGEKEKAAR